MWPELDVQTYVPPVGPEWTYIDSTLTEGWTGKVRAGWAYEPLILVQPDQTRVVIPHLLHTDAQVARTLGRSFVQVDVPFRGVWQGPVGIGNARIVAGYQHDWFLVSGVFHAPTTNLDFPSALQGPGFDLRTTVQHVGKVDVSGAAVAKFHEGQKPAYSGSLGVGFDFLRAEVIGTYATFSQIETGLTGNLRTGNWRIQPSLSAGVLASAGNPKLRAMLGVVYDPKKITPPEQPVETPPETPPAETQPTETFVGPILEPVTEVNEKPFTLNPDTGSTDQVPDTSTDTTPAHYSVSPPTHPGMGSLADTLRAHSEIIRVRLEVHTSCEGSKEQQKRRSEDAAELVRKYLIAEGIQEDRIEVVSLGATKPLMPCPEKTEEERKANRRVDARIIEIRR